MANKLFIGIPVRNDIVPFKVMIKSLLNSTDFYSKIVIIESASTDGVDKVCDELAEKHEKIQVIHTAHEGSLKAYNRLLTMAIEEESDILVTQTDVVFPKLYNRDWLEMMYCIARDPEVGAVGSLNAGGISGPDYIDGFKWLGGWCTYYKYETLKKVGIFDESYPLGYGVDIDHTMAILAAGFKIHYLNYWVDHHMFNERPHDKQPNSEEAKKAASKHFKKKWRIKDVLDR